MKNTINKIIIAAAVLFAAGLSNISANAQQAEMQVYEPVGNVMMLNTANNFIPVDVSGSLDDVLDLLQTETGWGQQYLNFSLLTNGMTIAASREQNNLPAVAGSINRELQSRDVVRFVDSVAATPITDITVRIYNKGGSDIFMAIGEESQTLAAAVSGDEFFIRSDTGELMTTPHRMNIGYQLTCDPATPIMETDGLSCREIESAADCPVATPDFVNGNCVPACLDTETRNSAGDCEPTPPTDANCGANAINDPADGTMCVCENTETHQFVAGSTTDCEPIPTNPNTPTCEEHQMLNSSNECVNRTAENCGNGEVFSPVNSGGICQTPAAFFAANTITVAARYSAESCERAGWISSIAINNEKTAAAEVCGIPVVRDDSVTITAAAAESVPLQFPENENANGCIIRESADFLTLPDCGDSELFGDGGFPQMPENFNIATDRLIVAVVADGRNRVFFNGNEIRTAVASLQNNETEVAIFGAVGIAMAAFAIVDFFHNGRPADAFAFSPEFGYRISENDYFVRAGGKIEYAVNENLRMQWSAGQTNSGGDFGDFRYLSKAEYKTDLFAAEFSESVSGKTADYDFSLSADVDGRLVDFSPVYRLHSEYDKGEFSTRNELNLQGNFRYNGWTINPSAGFRWENTNDFAENARFQINAIHRF